MDLAFIESLQPAGAAAPAGWRAGDAWLAGGTWLFSEPQPELRRLIDLHAFGWEPLRVSDAGLEVAATCRLSELAAFEPPPEWIGANVIRDCCEALLGSFKIWNEATVGGNICLALAAAPMTSLAASLDGVCEVWRPDGSVTQIPAVDFVTGIRSTVLEPGWLLRSVTLPARSLMGRVVFRQVSRTPLGRSAALVIGTREPAGVRTAITVTAAVTHPLQTRFDGLPSADELRAAIADAQPPYFEDAHGSIPWRAHLTAMLTEQVRAELAGGEDVPR
jgi:CO/xanthine dehydrogenase FAD-binding subunit